MLMVDKGINIERMFECISGGYIKGDVSSRFPLVVTEVVVTRNSVHLELFYERKERTLAKFWVSANQRCDILQLHPRLLLRLTC